MFKMAVQSEFYDKNFDINNFINLIRQCSKCGSLDITDSPDANHPMMKCNEFETKYYICQKCNGLEMQENGDPYEGLICKDCNKVRCGNYTMYCNDEGYVCDECEPEEIIMCPKCNKDDCTISCVNCNKIYCRSCDKQDRFCDECAIKYLRNKSSVEEEDEGQYCSFDPISK